MGQPRRLVDTSEVGAAADELRATIERLRVAVRALDDPAAAVVVASLGRESLDAVRMLLAGAESKPDQLTLDVFAEELDADARARLRDWILARLEVQALLLALSAGVDRLGRGGA
jgi:hypothetical protein